MTAKPSDECLREIVVLTKTLIRFKTTHSHPHEIQRCARFVHTWLQEHGISSTLVDHHGVPSVCALPSPKRVPVLLMSHIDVVSAEDTLFDPVERNGRLYGRGAIDDKYAVALSMVLLKNRALAHRRNGFDPAALPLGILITGDEEVGGKNGARRLLADLSCDFCIALDGGRVEKIVVKEKGVLRLKLISRGKTAHGARPWQGQNAIEKLIEDCRMVKVLFDFPDGGDHWHPTLNLSVIRGGESTNQVPDHAEAVLDIRYTEKDDVDDLVERIGAAVAGEVVVEMREPLFISPGSPYLDRLLALAPETRTGNAHGASDARFLYQFGIPGIVWGADGNGSQHAMDEHVEIRSMGRLYALLDRFFEATRP